MSDTVGEPGTTAGRTWLATEVALVTLTYIAATQLAVAAFDAAPLLPQSLGPAEARTGGVFLVGALCQLGFVAALAGPIAHRTFRQAVRLSFKPAPGRAWFIALSAAAIQCVTVALFFVPDPAVFLELSARKALLASITVPDGWTQEVVFRGYLILRLAQAGLPGWLQVAASGAAFASIHLGYIGSEGLGVFWPLVGTFMLGGVLALSVLAGRGSLLPAIVSHMLIVLIVQPWLALAT